MPKTLQNALHCNTFSKEDPAVLQAEGRSLARLLLVMSREMFWTEGERSMTTITTTAPVARKPLYTSLFVQVLAALVLGIVLGMAVSASSLGFKCFAEA